MPKPVMEHRALMEKSAGADLLREMIGFAAVRRMEPEVGARTGADYGKNSSDRPAQRSGRNGPRQPTSTGRHPAANLSCK